MHSLAAQRLLVTALSCGGGLSALSLLILLLPEQRAEVWTLLASRPKQFCLCPLTQILRCDMQMYSASWCQTAKNSIQTNFWSGPTCAESKQIHQYPFLSEQQTGMIYTSQCNAHNNNKLTMQMITLCTHSNSLHKQPICHTNLEFFSFSRPVTSH